MLAIFNLLTLARQFNYIHLVKVTGGILTNESISNLVEGFITLSRVDVKPMVLIRKERYFRIIDEIEDR